MLPFKEKITPDSEPRNASLIEEHINQNHTAHVMLTPCYFYLHSSPCTMIYWFLLVSSSPRLINFFFQYWFLRFLS